MRRKLSDYREEQDMPPYSHQLILLALELDMVVVLNRVGEPESELRHQQVHCCSMRETL